MVVLGGGGAVSCERGTPVIVKSQSLTPKPGVGEGGSGGEGQVQDVHDCRAAPR